MSLFKRGRFPFSRNPEKAEEAPAGQGEEEEEEDLSSDESFSSKNIDSENSSIQNEPYNYDDEEEDSSSTPTPTTKSTRSSSRTTTTTSSSESSSWVPKNSKNQSKSSSLSSSPSVHNKYDNNLIESDSDCDNTSSATSSRRSNRKRKELVQSSSSSFNNSILSTNTPYSNQQSSSSSIHWGQNISTTTTTNTTSTTNSNSSRQHNQNNSDNSIISSSFGEESKSSSSTIKNNNSSKTNNSNNKKEPNNKNSSSSSSASTARKFLLFPFFLGENRYLKKMYNLSIKYHKEICVVLFLLASGLPFLRSKPLKTRSVATPGPFFDQARDTKFVEDHYKGEYVELVQKKIPLAPSFVFYYAPWDSESLAAKDVFLEVAKHFHLTRGEQIKFYAVNCWWPDGQCRQNYKNLSHYPIFVAHIQGSAGIIYNGPIRAELMIRFLNLILRPVTRIDTEEELWKFRAEHDAVMLAFFNFTMKDSAAAYDIYLQMALRNLESDSLGQVGYGVFLQSNLAEKYFVTSSNSISLVLFNEIHTAKWDMRAPIKQVADWVMERTSSTPMTWAYRVRSGFSNRPVSLGPIDLAQELSNGPVLLLITRRYYPSAYSPFYAQIKEVALDYFNCNKSGNVTRLRRYTHKINADWLKLWKSVQRICSASKNTSFNCEIMKEQLKHWKNSETLLKRESLAEYDRKTIAYNFTGISCKSKKPLRFIAIDPVDIPHFIELALGGVSPPAITLTDQEPLSFLIDAKHNLLAPITSFTPSDIAEHIYNYTISMESSDPQNHSHSLQHTSRLWNEEKTKEKKPKDNRKQKKNQHNDIVIEKMNAEDVLNFVNEKEESSSHQPPLFLMFTARFCGYCGIALSQFVSLARFLGEYDLNIRLARVDVFRNSLPSHLTLGEIPSFLFFPAQNHSDVRIFPPGEEINVKNLLKFVLSELDPQTRIELSLKSPLCSDSGEEEPSDHTMSNLKLLSHRNNNDGENVVDTCVERNCSDNSNKISNKGTRRQQQNGRVVGVNNEEMVLSGREYCQNTNKELVTKQIESVLRVLQSDIGVLSLTNGNNNQLKFQQNDNQTFNINNNNSNYILQLPKFKYNYYNYAKLYLLKELQKLQLSTTYSSNEASSPNSKYDSSSSSSSSHDDGESESSLISFELESRQTWIIQLLDHLKRLRLYLDVM